METVTTQAPAAIKVVKRVYRDEHNALRSKLFLVINGQLVSPKKIVGFVYSWRTWLNAGRLYSRGDMVFEAYGVQYRMGTKTAKQLKLAEGERLETPDFDPTMGSFVKNPPADPPGN